MKPHPVYNTENKNKRPPRSPGKCKSHTSTNIGKQQQRSTGRACYKATSSRHTQTRCASRAVWGRKSWGTRGKCLCDGWRKQWKWNRVANKVKHLLPQPPQSQVNWIIRSQGKYRHHCPRIVCKTTSVWLHWGTASSLRTRSIYAGESEWRDNESPLTRPLSVKERHHRDRLQTHGALACSDLLLLLLTAQVHR